MQKTTTKKSASQFKPGNMYGIKEVYAQTSPQLAQIITVLREISFMYGFRTVETSLLEDEKLVTDYYKTQPHLLERVARSEFGGKKFVLRNAVLPSVLRYFSANKVHEEHPISKWMYFGSTVEIDEKESLHFDYDYGFEVLGTYNHLTESQVIAAAWDLAVKVGLEEENLVLAINTTGDPTVQNTYQSAIKDYIKLKEYELCDDCVAHAGGRPLNAFRCSNLDCQLVMAEAPAAVDFLTGESKKQFTDILEALDELGLPYQLNQGYVGAEGSSRANVSLTYVKDDVSVLLGEASCHELLMKSVTGKPAISFGFTGRISSLTKAIELCDEPATSYLYHDVFLVPLGELASKKSLRLFRDLIGVNIKVHDHFGTAGVKNQLKLAEESKAPIALIMGQKEAMDEMVILRDVKSGMQEIFPYDKIIDEVQKRLEK